jgi:hypothetical protein
MIKTQTLSSDLSKGFYGFPLLENLLISAWEKVAVSQQDLSLSLQQTHESFGSRLEQNALLRDDRAYLSRQMIVLAAETVEMVGAALIRFREGRPTEMVCDLTKEVSRFRGFHQATNHELEAVLGSPVTSEEALGFLGIPLPPPTTELLRSSGYKMAATAARHLSYLGQYWTEVIRGVRAFRHLPVSLTLDEVERIDGSSPELASVRAKAAELGEQLEDLSSILDGNAFYHTPLTSRDAMTAFMVFRAAISFLFTASGNQLLSPDATTRDGRVPKVPKLLLKDLTLDESAELRRWNGYVFAY